MNNYIKGQWNENGTNSNWMNDNRNNEQNAEYMNDNRNSQQNAGYMNDNRSNQQNQYAGYMNENQSSRFDEPIPGTCGGLIHVVRQGDTLYKLSQAYHVSVSDIMYENPYANVYNLQIGDELCIPVSKRQY